MAAQKTTVKTIKIFDTTLRDGEQSPGASMNIDEKLRIARQLQKLNVDVIEAGFPIASEGISRQSKRSPRPLKGRKLPAYAAPAPRISTGAGRRCSLREKRAEFTPSSPPPTST